jgi:hypothetical protein
VGAQRALVGRSAGDGLRRRSARGGVQQGKVHHAKQHDACTAVRGGRRMVGGGGQGNGAASTEGG